MKLFVDFYTNLPTLYLDQAVTVLRVMLQNDTKVDFEHWQEVMMSIWNVPSVTCLVRDGVSLDANARLSPLSEPVLICPSGAVWTSLPSKEITLGLTNEQERWVLQAMEKEEGVISLDEFFELLIEGGIEDAVLYLQNNSMAPRAPAETPYSFYMDCIGCEINTDPGY